MGVIRKDYPVPANEAERVSALQALGILGSPRDLEFDTIVALACEAFDVPIALVSLLDEQRQWFKASQGVEVCSTDRESAFCNYPVSSGDLLVVPDATLDARFNRNRLVTGGPLIRFYAGIPLALEPGVHLGTLCILDTRPRAFTMEQAGQLARMATVVTALLRQYRDARVVRRLAEDLEERGRYIRAQTRSLAHYRRIVDRASALARMGAWECDLKTDAITWTDGMYDVHEMPRGSFMTRPRIYETYSAVDRVRLEKLRAEALREGRGFTFEAEMTTARGNRRWVRLTVDIECENGVAVRLYGMKQDITEQKTLSDRLRLLAECDLLTGLPNRAVLQARLLGATVHGSEAGRIGALLLIDLDGFKHVNDTFGHPVGDECLKQIAARLQRICRDAELVARLGGDEFAVLFHPGHDRAAVERCAEHILAELRRPVRSRGQSFQLSGSVGIAIRRGVEGSDASQLLTEADLALYAAKAAGRNVFLTFNPRMKTAADARSRIVREISKALDGRQLELFYQPKMDLAKGALAGFEALLRWRKPNGQVIAAGAFTEALEDPRLSGRIGEWVVETALRQAGDWHRAGLAFRHVAINLSSAQFYETEFAARLIERIAEHGLSPDMIEVEVTEGVILSQETSIVRKTLEALKAAGVRIALDDFGTGYASLVHLRTYAVDIIKIDKTFVQNFLTSGPDNAILQSTLFLARRLNVDVVAEGIEETEQCEFLKALGCRYGQGFLFSKAVPAAEAALFCARRPTRADLSRRATPVRLISR